MDSAIVHAAMAEAEETGTPVAELSLDRIARRAGVSRSTIYRRVRSRDALNDAVRAAGGDPGSRVGVRERAIAAATEVIVADGVGALTVEGVARRVGCAVTSLYTAFGGREGMLDAVFQRHAPLPVVERLLSTQPQRFADLDTGVRAIYTAIFDVVADDTAVLEALFSEILARPNGIGSHFFRDRVLPRITATVGGWLQGQIKVGHCVDLPLSLLVPLLIAPISVHLLARSRLAAAGASVPARETVIDAMTSAFCNATSTSRE
ncbi:HTH-type transcriptional regulator BetI [Mycobacterium simulans]|uniref:HTH-type transcriptional regulator BetI n=1 Tax=Mycobacterium simulans TaxID=627089 RepID=A0A7Z7N8U1_9MYCO|nr:TetR/AcrR family transcriptional regulator [Mycobacterium simulans]SOJ54095.1 HTH-type transcriptional regulator BetI [Mycobacterium simulans]